MGQQTSRRIKGYRSVAAALLLGATLAACSPMKSSNGYLPDEELVQRIRPGVHDKDSVAQLLGSPTAQAKFKDDVWLYVRRKSERIAFFNDTVKQQDVLAIRFNDAGIVEDLERYSLEDGKPVEPVERVTPTRGRELTFLEQLFGNVGRFTNSGTGGTTP